MTAGGVCLPIRPPARSESTASRELLLTVKSKTKTVPKIKQQKNDANGAPWQPDFEYECDTCRCVVVPKKELTDLKCPSFRHGSPCTGKLSRFGKGTGRGSHFKKEQ